MKKGRIIKIALFALCVAATISLCGYAQSIEGKNKGDCKPLKMERGQSKAKQACDEQVPERLKERIKKRAQARQMQEKRNGGGDGKCDCRRPLGLKRKKAALNRLEQKHPKAAKAVKKRIKGKIKERIQNRKNSVKGRNGLSRDKASGQYQGRNRTRRGVEHARRGMEHARRGLERGRSDRMQSRRSNVENDRKERLGKKFRQLRNKRGAGESRRGKADRSTEISSKRTTEFRREIRETEL